MPQSYRKKTNAEPRPILEGRKAATVDKLAPDHAIAIAGLVSAAIRNGNAVYLQTGRYGSLTFKVYIEGEQFAEALQLDDQLEDLCEQIVEALYTPDDVAWNRRAFGTALVVPAPKARKETDPGAR